MTKAKYEKGEPIRNFMDLVAYIMADAIFYIADRAVPAAFLANWQMARLQMAAKSGSIRLAERKAVNA